jgi:uncharacterized protein YegJ (DUF2314 family)
MFQSFKRKKTAKSEHHVVSLPSDDEVLEASKKEAQEGLDYLIESIQNNEKNEELFRYAIKANFIDNDDAEHMWVQVNDFRDGLFIGRLANEPKTIKFLKYGDYVNVLPENVEDWILEDFMTNTKVGHFSGQYLHRKAQQGNKEIN